MALNGTPVTQLWDVTCHMGSHSVTCYPTQVNAPRLKPSPQAGTRFTFPEGWKAELTQVAGYIPRWFTIQQTVANPSINPTLMWINYLIAADVLTTTLTRHPNYSATSTRPTITFDVNSPFGSTPHLSRSWVPKLPHLGT